MNNSGIIVVYVFAIIVALLIRGKISSKFNLIAQQKGHYDVHAFAMCFWLGLVGYLYVIALPDLSIRHVCIKNEIETKQES